MTRDKLPSDPEALKDLVMESHQRAELLQSQLDALKTRVFGRHRSEQWHREQAAGQQTFEFAELPTPPEKAPEAAPVNSNTEEQKRKGGRRAPIPGNLPRERREHTLPEKDRLCACCGEVMQPFGEEVSEQIEKIPAKLFVIEHARIKYSCRKCESKPVIAETPDKVIDKGLAGPGLIADIVVSKFDFHLPLHRQEEMFARHGMKIARSTMCGWLGMAAELMKPIYRWMSDQILRSKKIHTDDTSIQVQDPGNHKTKTARLWVYYGDDGHPHVVFEYTTTRGRDGPLNYLQKYEGYLRPMHTRGMTVFTPGRR